MMFNDTRNTGDTTEDDCLLDTCPDFQFDDAGDRELLQLGMQDDEDDELLKLEKELEEEQVSRGCVDRALDGISVFLVRLPHPYVPGSLLVLICLLALFFGIGYVSYQKHPPQEFIDAILDDATVGFETRGTYIKRGQSTAKQLFDEILGSETSKYTVIPNKTLALQQLGASDATLQYLFSMDKSRNGQQGSDADRGESHRSRSRRQTPNDSFTDCRTLLCDVEVNNGQTYVPIASPEMYFVFVVEAWGEDLYTVDRMRSLCTLEDTILLPLFEYQSNCLMCGLPVSRSLPDIIASYFQKDCQHLTSDDLNIFRNFLNKCLNSFAPLLASLGDDESSDGNININGGASTTTTMGLPTSEIPEDCANWKDMVLDVHDFLVDKSFTNLSAENPLKYATVLVQSGAYLDDPLKFYHEKIENSPRISVNDLEVTAFGVNHESVKWDLFQEYFISDTLWFGLAMGLVFIVMLLYLLRIDLVLATIISVAFGFIFAYAIYYFILDMKFFPFINLLALLVLIAVGADDVFVFFDIYQQTKKAHPEMTLEKVISRTLSHAALSVFVTSLTTSAAFFANAVSNITAIKVFGIFAGIAILVNFFVMVLVVPCIIILVEKLLMLIRGVLNPLATKILFCECWENWEVIVFLRNIFDVYFPRLIGKTWYIWLVLLSLLSILAGVAVFAYPKFKLPDTKDFQLFPTSNLLENWFFNVNKHFYFVEDEGNVPMVRASYIFGFEAVDGGNHWDPSNKTTHLIEDEDFDFYDADTQNWLSQFCEDQKVAEYVPDRLHDYTCNFEAYKKTVEAICKQIPPQIKWFVPKINECCISNDVPFNDTQLEHCIPVYMSVLFNELPSNIQGQIHHPNVSGRIFGDLIFEQSTNRVKGYLLYVVTKWPYTFNYDVMQEHYNSLAGDFIQRVKSAPKGLQGGFVGFNADFYFYDLQHSLATGAYYSVGLSLAVAFLVMLFTSLNVLITVYAMLSITLAITCTIATIVLMGWHLNVIEAVIISLSVGLSIDFTIHYGVAYRLSEAKEAKLRVRDSFHKVGGAVAMAALTTFLAGAGLMPCRVLPYIKLGIFLMLVMLFAWLYANFFFQSLCRIIGPHGNFCQISALCSKRKQRIARDPDRMSLNSVGSDDSLLVTF